MKRSLGQAVGSRYEFSRESGASALRSLRRGRGPLLPVLLAVLLSGGAFRYAAAADAAPAVAPAAAPIAAPAAAATPVAELKLREQRVQQVVKKALPCTVCLENDEGSGSGVIVSADGLVLTAAHVTGNVGEKYRVIFPDGRTVQGVALGLTHARDAGMLKIQDEGTYPFVELGTSASLKRGDWCIALGHAGGFDIDRTPPVRLGQVLRTGLYLQTDCAVISGDSGGPLFDLDGKLIGIHSNIGESLTENNHIPIDVYRDSWDRMKNGEKWGGPMKQPKGPRGPKRPPGKGGKPAEPPASTEPKPGEQAGATPPAKSNENNKGPKAPERSIEELLRLAKESGGKLDMTPEEMKRLLDYTSGRMNRAGVAVQDAPATSDWRSQLIDAYRPVVATAMKGTYRVYAGNAQVALATAVSEHTLLTKASEIGRGAFQVQVAENQKVPCEIVERFDKYDLALIRPTGGAGATVVFQPVAFAPADTALPLGTFVAAVGPVAEPEAIGVVSVESRHLAAVAGGYLGIGLDKGDDAIRISEVAPKSPAMAAGLKPHDVILKLDDKAYATPAEFVQAITGHKPGDTVSLVVRRGDKEVTAQAKLGDRSKFAAAGDDFDRAFNGGRLSRNRTGYPNAVQHDCPLRPTYCGGPLVDLDGRVIGINIARAGRIQSYAIPAADVQQLLSQSH